MELDKETNFIVVWYPRIFHAKYVWCIASNQSNQFYFKTYHLEEQLILVLHGGHFYVNKEEIKSACVYRQII